MSSGQRDPAHVVRPALPRRYSPASATHGSWPMAPRLENKVCLVTGGAHGIGRAYCLRFAEEGARVVIADIDHLAAEQGAHEVEALGGEALALHVDVASARSCEEMAAAAVTRFGRIDVLVTNAAVF